MIDTTFRENSDLGRLMAICPLGNFGMISVGSNGFAFKMPNGKYHFRTWRWFMNMLDQTSKAKDINEVLERLNKD